VRATAEWAHQSNQSATPRIGNVRQDKGPICGVGALQSKGSRSDDPSHDTSAPWPRLVMSTEAIPRPCQAVSETAAGTWECINTDCHGGHWFRRINTDDDEGNIA
jgi:hypothetical protein